MLRSTSRHFARHTPSAGLPLSHVSIHTQILPNRLRLHEHPAYTARTRPFVTAEGYLHKSKIPTMHFQASGPSTKTKRSARNPARECCDRMRVATIVRLPHAHSIYAVADRSNASTLPTHLTRHRLCQKSLPRMPIPALDETLDKYLVAERRLCLSIASVGCPTSHKLRVLFHHTRPCSTSRAHRDTGAIQRSRSSCG